jgi:thiamine-monophosphate kinase
VKLTDIGEFGLIERITSLFNKDISPDTLGIGDDCAVIPQGHQQGHPKGGQTGKLPGDQVDGVGGVSSAEESFLVTTDMLVENVHFLKKSITAEELGYKSLAVNLSDIAGMGGKPLFCFLSIALPSSIDTEWTDGFFRGFKSLADETGTSLMGGDTTGSKNDIVINVTVIGKAVLENIKYRSGAKEGDLICITGFTGESGAGLNVLLNDLKRSTALDAVVKSHNCPRPHIEEGFFLSLKPGVHSMMDVSDGIDSDIRHILKRSGVSAEVYIEKIPISEKLEAASKESGIDPLKTALTAGEDYCLLLTIDPDSYQEVNNEFTEKFAHPLFCIGQIKSGSGELDYIRKCEKVSLGKKGFDHFILKRNE